MRGCVIFVLIVVVVVAGGWFFRGAVKSKLREAASSVLRVDPNPLSDRRYLKEGFPDPGLSRSWGLSQMAQFKAALQKFASKDSKALPNADTEFGKKSFQQMVRMMNKLASVPPKAQISLWNQLVEVEEIYVRAFNDGRVRYDRELSLIRGLLLQGYSIILPKGEVEFQGELFTRKDIQRLQREGGKEEIRKRISQAISERLQPGSGWQNAQLRDTTRVIVEEAGDHALFRPEARRIIVRYLRDYYPIVRTELRQSLDPEIQANLAKETDQETIGYYKELIAK